MVCINTGLRRYKKNGQLRFQVTMGYWSDGHFWTHILKRNVSISNDISLKYITESLIEDKSSLIQVVAWYWSGDKPLLEAVMTKHHDAR